MSSPDLCSSHSFDRASTNVFDYSIQAILDVMHISLLLFLDVVLLVIGGRREEERKKRGRSSYSGGCIIVVLMVIGHIVVVFIANHPFKPILTKDSRY